MARIKYYDSVTQQWVYGDMALQPPLPTGTANGDILVWDNINQEWVVKPKWQIHFQPVEYIESTGKGNYNLGDRYQYINTDYIPTADTVIEAEIAFTDDTATAGQFIGVRNWRSATDTRALFLGLRYSGGTKYLALFTMYPESTPAQIAFDTDKHSYIITPTEQKIDNNTFTLDYSNMPSDANSIPFYLFANNAYFYNQSTPPDIGFASCRIYSFKIKEGNTLVRDFIPCYRISDSVIGMYDIVNNVFYTNAGSDTFLKGADV